MSYDVLDYLDDCGVFSTNSYHKYTKKSIDGTNLSLRKRIKRKIALFRARHEMDIQEAVVKNDLWLNKEYIGLEDNDLRREYLYARVVRARKQDKLMKLVAPVAVKRFKDLTQQEREQLSASISTPAPIVVEDSVEGNTIKADDYWAAEDKEAFMKTAANNQNPFKET